MPIQIRKEKVTDYDETENVTREAFWDVYKPGCDEHLVLHRLRQSEIFVTELDLVACDNGKIVGNIVYSKALVLNSGGNSEVLCMGPVCSLPAYQGKGIGSMLLRTTIEKARALGYKAVVIFGDPAYYHRFGFVNAKQYGIKPSMGDNCEEFMALELFPGALADISGVFQLDKAFVVDKEELAKYDSGFPYKEKHKREGQLE